MEKLTLKEIAGYLPYGLKVLHIDTDEIEQSEIITELESACSECLTFKDGADFYFEDSDVTIKPILRPLSELLTKEFNFIWEKETDFESIEQWIESEEVYMTKFSLEFWEDLFKHHFDIHGLIEAGFAIDKNILK